MRQAVLPLQEQAKGHSLLVTNPLAPNSPLQIWRLAPSPGRVQFRTPPCTNEQLLKNKQKCQTLVWPRSRSFSAVSSGYPTDRRQPAFNRCGQANTISEASPNLELVCGKEEVFGGCNGKCRYAALVLPTAVPVNVRGPPVMLASGVLGATWYSTAPALSALPAIRRSS